MEREKVLDIIVKLMTLASDPGAPQGEVDAAKHKAAHLMAKYQIEASEAIGKKSTSEIKADIKENQSRTATTQSDWPAYLANSIADCFDCRIMYSWDRKNIIFYGLKDDVEICKYLFAKIQITIAIRAENAYVKVSDQEAYALGASWRVGERVKEMYVEAQKYMGNDCRDLIIVKKDAVGQFLKEKFPNARSSEPLDDYNKKNRTAISRGYTEANTINLEGNRKRVDQ